MSFFKIHFLFILSVLSLGLFISCGSLPNDVLDPEEDDEQEQTTYSVVYELGSSTSGSIPVDSNRYVSGELFTALGNSGNLSLSEHSFTGWTNASGTLFSAGSTYAMPETNLFLYPRFSALPTYSVTYYAPLAETGAVPTDDNLYLAGDSVLLAANSAALGRDGFQITGWSNISGETFSFSEAVSMPSNDLNFYALWTPVYELTYIGNGGTPVPVDTNVYFTGELADVSDGSLMTNGTYRFDGWTNANGDTVSGTTTISVENITLYASWEEGFGITYFGNGGTNVPVNNAIYYEGDTIDIDGGSSIGKTGYRFDDWTNANGDEVSGTTTIGVENIILYASWEKGLGITYIANGGTNVPVDNAIYYEGDTIDVDDGSAIGKTGYRFVEWTNANGDEVSGTTTIGVENITLYASWEEGFGITYFGNGGTPVPVDNAIYYEGDTIDIDDGSSIGKTGYRFVEWTNANGDEVSGTTTIESENITLYASWEEDLGITYIANGGTPVPVDSAIYYKGDTIDVDDGSSIGKTGYRFDGWTNANGDTVSGTTTIGVESITLYASWEEGFRIFYIGNGGEPVTTNTNLYFSGDEITVDDGLTIEKESYIFSAWTNESGQSYSNGAVLTFSDEEIVLYAKWIYDFSQISEREMVAVPEATYDQYYSSSQRFRHTVDAFNIGKYEVTYKLWYEVYTWATNNDYQFENVGNQGSSIATGVVPSPVAFPVSRISWRDIIVWCNAYSEMSGKLAVYLDEDGNIIKDSRDSNESVVDAAIPNWSANGFRLPTEGEWQFAASLRYYISPTEMSIAPPTSVPGADVYTEVGEIAWYDDNTSQARPVGLKPQNYLGLYDMSGNVSEIVWDTRGNMPSGPQINYRGSVVSHHDRKCKGGAYSDSATGLQIYRESLIYTSTEHRSIGFRVANYN